MVTRFLQNTEEAFILSSLKEFVKVWGSGNQATLHVECKNGQAWLNFSSLLGPPAAFHFVHQQHSHGIHGGAPTPSTPRRKKGPGPILRDRARAEAHRAKSNTNKAVAAVDDTIAKKDPSKKAISAEIFRMRRSPNATVDNSTPTPPLTAAVPPPPSSNAADSASPYLPQDEFCFRIQPTVLPLPPS